MEPNHRNLLSYDGYMHSHFAGVLVHFQIHPMCLHPIKVSWGHGKVVCRGFTCGTVHEQCDLPP